MRKTISLVTKKGKKIVRKVMKDSLMKEYFEKQKKLTKDTLDKVVNRAEKAIDRTLE